MAQLGAYGGSPNPIFGNGMYQPPPINVDPGQFNNAAGGVAGQNLNQQLGGGYLAGTTQPVTAQQSAGGGSAAGYTAGMAGQLGLANQYAQMAAGQGPSLAALQAQQQGQQNLAASESMLGSARGAGNPQQAMLAARTAQASGAQQVAQNAVAGRTQEELGAMGAEGGLYGNIAGQGLQQQGLVQANNQFNASQANQIGQGNQANNLSAYSNYLNALNSVNGQQQQGQIQNQQLQAQTQLGQEGIANSAYNNSANHNLFGAIGQLGSAAANGVAGLASSGMFL